MGTTQSYLATPLRSMFFNKEAMCHFSEINMMLCLNNLVIFCKGQRFLHFCLSEVKVNTWLGKVNHIHNQTKSLKDAIFQELSAPRFHIQVRLIEK